MPGNEKRRAVHHAARLHRHGWNQHRWNELWDPFITSTLYLRTKPHTSSRGGYDFSLSGIPPASFSSVNTSQIAFSHFFFGCFQYFFVEKIHVFNLLYNLILVIRGFDHLLYGALPYNHLLYLLREKLLSDSIVTPYVAFKFLFPEINTAFGRVSIFTICMAMPKTAIHKNCSNLT